jgi:hypothetical protein
MEGRNAVKIWLAIAVRRRFRRAAVLAAALGAAAGGNTGRSRQLHRRRRDRPVQAQPVLLTVEYCQLEEWNFGNSALE